MNGMYIFRNIPQIRLVSVIFNDPSRLYANRGLAKDDDGLIIYDPDFRKR